MSTIKIATLAFVSTLDQKPLRTRNANP